MSGTPFQRSCQSERSTPFILLLPLICWAISNAVSCAQDSVSGLDRERFVPADQFGTIFEASPRGVLLPREEFQELLTKAQQAQADNANVPVPVVVRSASYRVTRADKHALVELILDVEQFANNWVTLRVPVGNLLVEEATIGGNPAAIGRDPHHADMLTLVHRTVGQFQLKLSLSTPLGTVGSDRVVAFRTVANTSAVVDVLCPAKEHLEVSDLKLERPTPVTEPATYRFPTGGSESVRLKWTTRQQEADSQTLVFVKTEAATKLSSEDIRWNSTTRLSVFGNPINQVIARVPGRLEITSVDSTGLESWKLEDDTERTGFTRLLLNYRQPLSEDRQIAISAVAAISEGENSKLPTLEFIEVTSHTGRLLVHHEDQLRLMAEVGGGVRHLGTRSPSNKQPGGEVFDFWLQDYDLSVAIKPRDRELFAELNSTLSILDTTATFICEASIESLNAPLFELSVELPKDWQIGYVTDENNAPIRWRVGNSESQIFLEPETPIPSGGILTLNVSLSKTIQDPSTAQLLDLPVLTANETLVVGGIYRISTANDLTITPLKISGLSTIGDDGGTLLFETQGTEVSGQLSVVRKPIRLASRAVLKSWMDTRQKTVEAVVTVDVMGGTTRTLRLQLPEDLGPDLRFDVVSIGAVPGVTGQKVPSNVSILEQAVGEVIDGVRTYELTFNKRFVGAVTLKTIARQPRQTNTQLFATFARVVGATRQHGLVVFEAYPEQQLAANDADLATSGLTVADSGLVEAPADSSGRRTALVYRFIQPEYSLAIEETRFDTEAVPSAVCESIANVSVLSDSGMIQRSCRAQVQCVGVQTLRFVLPDADNSYLWSTILNEQAVEVRRDGDNYLVAIPSVHEGTQHVLEVLFQSTADDANLLGETSQQSLRLRIDADQGKAAEVEILEQTWDVHYPSSSILVNEDGGFHSLKGPEKPGWIQSIASSAYLPKTGEIVDRIVPVGIFVFSLIVLTALIIRRRWASLICLCVLALIVIPILIDGASRYEMTAGTDVSFDTATTATFDDESDTVTMEAASSESAPNDKLFGVNEIGEYGATRVGGGMGGFSPDMQPQTMNNGTPNVVPGQNVVANGGVISEFEDTPKELPIPSAPAFGSRQLTFPSPGPPAATGGASYFGREPRKPVAGSARLSIRATVAQPDDYRSMQFRSIGGTESAGTLKVVVRPRSYFSSLRIIAAAAILLLCLWVNSTSVNNKLCIAVCCLLSATAGTALVSNQWQSAVDGVVIGTFLGIGLWIGSSVIGCIKSGCCNFVKAPATANAAVSLIIFLFLTPALVKAAPQEDATKSKRPEVVLPYTPGRPELSADRVFLPREEFLKLYKLAYPDEITEGQSPTASKVVGAFYKSGERTQISESHWTQSFQVRYLIRSFADARVKVSLPISGIAVRSATLNGDTAVLQAETGRTIPLAANGNQKPVQQLQQKAIPNSLKVPDRYSVRIESAGLHLLDVNFDVLATIENSVGRIDLELQPVASGTLIFELPDEKLEARINGRSDAFRVRNKTLTVPIAASSNTRIDWRPESTTTQTDTIYHSAVSSALLLSDAGLTLQSTIKLHCRQGQLAELDVQLPADYAMQTVRGTDIAGWEKGDENAETLKLLFRAPIDGESTINLTLFKKQTIRSEESNIDVPVPAIIGASRDSGNVTVLAGTELAIRVSSLSGVSQLNAEEATVPDGISARMRRVLAWRYTRHPAKIVVRVSRTSQQSKITILNGVQLEPQRQLWTTLVNARISGAPRRRLEVYVPKDFLALDVNANDLADWYYTDAPDSSTDTKILNIQFDAAKQGTVNAVIQGQIGRASDASTAKLIAPKIASADETVTHLSLWLDAASEIAKSEFSGWKRTGSETQIDQRIRQLKPAAPDISFTSQISEPPPIVLSLRQAPASLLAESVTVTNVTDTAIKLTLGLNWQISGAATRELSFVIPTELNDVLDFTVPGLRQLGKEAFDDGVRITLHLQQPVSERFFVLGTGTLPIATSKQILARPPRFIVRESTKASISSQSHFWVIVNQSDGVLEAVDPRTDGDDVSPNEIKTNIPQGFLQQSVAIRRLKSDRPNSAWQLKFPERQRVSPAVIALAAHTTIIAADGTWRSRHELQMRNESRQFLPITLPDNSRILYCLVKNQPTRVLSRTVTLPAGDKTLHLIPIPQSGELAAPFDVQVALVGRLTDTSASLAGDAVQIPAPSFPEYRDFPDYGITVSRNTWSVYVPKEWQADIINNPRQTNVVPAADGDFSDVILFACVDNVKSMLNSLSSSKTSNSKFGNTDVLWGELNRQKLLLQQQKGNNRLAEQQRTQALQEIELQLGEVTGIVDNENVYTDYEGPVSGAIRGYAGTVQELGRNFFLESQEGASNSFDAFNNDALIMSNSVDIDGIRPGSGVSSGGVFGGRASGSDSGANDSPTNFRFVLPDIEDLKRKKTSPRFSPEPKSEVRKSNQASSALAPATVSPKVGKPQIANDNRSQLLKRRQLNVQQQAEEAKQQQQRGRAQSDPFEDDAKISQDDMPAPVSQRAAPPSVAANQQQAGREVDFTGSTAAPTGLLSLQFQIPEDGVRHDFVRTGGNAELSLNVRSRDSVNWALGVIWAAGCFIAAMILLKAASSGSNAIVFRLILLTAAAGLIGWLCLPTPTRGTALTVLIGAAIVASLMLIVQSYREPARATANPIESSTL